MDVTKPKGGRVGEKKGGGKDGISAGGELSQLAKTKRWEGGDTWNLSKKKGGMFQFSKEKDVGGLERGTGIPEEKKKLTGRWGDHRKGKTGGIEKNYHKGNEKGHPFADSQCQYKGGGGAKSALSFRTGDSEKKSLEPREQARGGGKGKGDHHTSR